MSERDNSLSGIGVKRLAEVERLEIGNSLFDRYREKYKERYGGYPIILNEGSGRTVLKDLARKVGGSKAAALVDKYLEMRGRDDWFIKQAHSLSTLQSKIEEVNAALSYTERKSATPNKRLKIIFGSWCPTCPNPTSITCFTDEMEKLACSVPCDSCKNQADELSPGIEKLNRPLDSKANEEGSKTTETKEPQRNALY